MQYRVDKRSGNKLSALGFGCMRLPGGRKTEALLLDAINQGVNYFDTAYLYPGSEDAVGDVLARHDLREKVFLATKLPHYMCRGEADFDKFFNVQKRRLRTVYIDYYMLHNITNYSQWERLKSIGMEKWIAAKKASGEIKRMGFSFHGSYHEFELLLKDYDWDFVQIQFNYININYQAGEKGLKLAEDKGIPVIIMEPLLGGKLSNLSKAAASIFEKAKPGSTPTEWALRFVWNSPGATVLLSGMNQPAQLTENLKTVETAPPENLTEAELLTIQAVKKEFGKSYKIPCTGCNYCMPCPQKINIPACFEAYNASYAINWAAGLQQYLTSIGAMSAAPGFASNCTSCGKCVKQCPQNIKIPEEMQNVKKRLQPSGMKGILKFVGRVVRGKE